MFKIIKKLDVDVVVVVVIVVVVIVSIVVVVCKFSTSHLGVVAVDARHKNVAFMVDINDISVLNAARQKAARLKGDHTYKKDLTPSAGTSLI